MRVSIIIPAYNEEYRIAKTLQAYNAFFLQKQQERILDYEVLVIVNGTTDNTVPLVKKLQQTMPALLMEEIAQGGKGLAIIYGFFNALTRDNDLIGFVDADMATSPDAFYALIMQCRNNEGVIASRYMKGSIVHPKRPFIKRWGSKIFFKSSVRTLFGISYYDTQCGAKIFKREVIQKIVTYLHEPHWSLDIEILYLCKRFGFIIQEVPTIWHDQAGSKLQTFRAGMGMLKTLIKMRMHYWRRNNNIEAH